MANYKADRGIDLLRLIKKKKYFRSFWMLRTSAQTQSTLTTSGVEHKNRTLNTVFD